MLLRKVQGAAAGVNDVQAVALAASAPEAWGAPPRTAESAGLTLGVDAILGLSHALPPIGVSTHDRQRVSRIHVAVFTGGSVVRKASVCQVCVQQFHPTGSMATWPSLPSHSTTACEVFSVAPTNSTERRIGLFLLRRYRTLLSLDITASKAASTAAKPSRGHYYKRS
jgi:hypothetical protein